jgi:alanine dehydrogenase
MIIGVPRETKAYEYRIAMLPVGADLLVRDGNTVLIEKGAGMAMIAGTAVPEMSNHVTQRERKDRN